MKISIQQYKNTVTWEGECDSCLDEVINQIKGLLVAAGYHPHNVDSAFVPDAFEWFPEEPDHGQESELTPNWNKPHPNAGPLQQAVNKDDEF